MFVVGIDIGGMTIKAGLIDENGKILQKAVCDTLPERNYKEIVKDLSKLVHTLCEKQGISIDVLGGVGIGSPGAIDCNKGIIVYAGNLNCKNAPLVQELGKYINVPIYLGNDADCAALGETKYGSGEGVANAIMVTLGTGIGTGFIINNQILQGGLGIGGEGGHICIEVDGQQCTCGEKGCWEAYASATALIRLTKEAMAKDKNSLLHKVASEQGEVNGRTSFIAYKKGDKTAIELVNKYVKYLATGLISYVNVFRPQIIILGGGVSNEGEYFIKMVEDYVKEHAFGKSFNKICKIVGATLGNDAGIIGAGMLAMGK
ncbi:MAG: ROK family protein [Clostridia bacterium]